MFKEALLFGIGMAVDISGMSYIHSQPASRPEPECIASDWREVGKLIQFSIQSERPKIEAEAAKQLDLQLSV